MEKAVPTTPVGKSRPRTEARQAVLTSGLIIFCSLIAASVYAWLTLGSDSMSASGYVALALGIIGTLGLAVGLMTLVFFSNRYGYDEGVGERDSKDAPP